MDLADPFLADVELIAEVFQRTRLVAAKPKPKGNDRSFPLRQFVEQPINGHFDFFLTVELRNRVFDRTGRIEDAARFLGVRNLQTAAEIIGYDW